MKRHLILILTTIVIISFSLVLIVLISIQNKYRQHLFTNDRLDQVPFHQTALVLGAGLTKDGKPTKVLNERVKAGVVLYQKGKVKKLLMSGDNRFYSHNEPDAMKELAIELGVPEKDVIADYGGRRTFDSCWRTKNIFSQNEITVVTQEFHLLRSVFLCDQLGIKTDGYVASGYEYLPQEALFWKARDMAALLVWFVQVHISTPGVAGEKIQIGD
jgi:SanA protein